MNKSEKPNFTVGDLKKILKDIPNDTPIGITDYYGEFREFSYLPEVKTNLRTAFGRVKIPISFCFEAVDIGPEPD